MRDLRAPAFVESEKRIDAGGGVTLVWVEQVVQPEKPWIEHECVCGDGEKALNAVALHPQHEMTGEYPTVTIHPSILCPPPCGLHGWIRDSVWVST